jgi:hypothetical protein
MAIKKISTEFQLLDKFLDTSGNAGSINQVLVSTSTGIDWVNGSGSGIIGGPYLLLAGGTMDASANINMNSGTLSSVDSIDFGIGQLNGTSTSNLILKSLGDITYNVDSNNNGNSSHIFQESGSELMRIRYDGNVGIGTTSPSYKLEVNGNIRAGVGGTTATDAVLTLDSGNASGGEAYISLERNSVSGFLLNHSLSSIQVRGLSNLPMHFYTNNAIKQTILSNGNVGIGTTSPSYKLEVSGSANNADVGIRINNTFDDNNPASEPNSVVFLNAASNNGYLRVHGAPANTSAKHQIDLGSTAATSFLTFSPSGSERMRIASSGNVGIGTAAPGCKLHVGGTSTVAYNPATVGGQNSASTIKIANDTTDANTYAAINFSTNSNRVVNRIVSSHAGTTNRGFLAFVTEHLGVPDERMRIDSAGNVGIGTDSPTRELDVEGGITSSTNGNRVKGNINLGLQTDSITKYTSLVSNQYLSTTESEGYSLVTGISTSTYNRTSIGGGLNEQNAATEIRFYTADNTTTRAGTSRMTIGATGNVGIGTTSPDTKLHVESTSNANSPILTIENDDAKQIELGVVRSIAGIEPNTSFLAYDNDFRFIAGAGSTNEVMRIDSNGNVGIGNDSPVVSLDLSTKNDAVSLPVGDDAARPSTPVPGMIRYNVSASEFEGYSGVLNVSGSWGALGGGGGGASTITTNSFSGNGTVGPFTLGATPSGGSTSFVDVFIDGVYQEIANYTVSGTALSFVTGSEPPTGTNIQTKTTSGAVSGALVSSVDIGQSSGNTGAVNLRIVPLEVTSGLTISGSANSLYIFTATTGSVSTLTLPASPTAGDSIKISNLGGLANVLGANGNKIMGQASDMTIDTPTAAFELIWSGSNSGWIIIGNV